MLGLVHERSELRPPRAELIGDVAPGLSGALAVGLNEGLPDRRRDHGVLTLRHMRQSIPHEVNPGAVEEPRLELPGGAV